MAVFFIAQALFSHHNSVTRTAFKSFLALPLMHGLQVVKGSLSVNGFW